MTHNLNEIENQSYDLIEKNETIEFNEMFVLCCMLIFLKTKLEVIKN